MRMCTNLFKVVKNKALFQFLTFTEKYKVGRNIFSGSINEKDGGTTVKLTVKASLITKKESKGSMNKKIYQNVKQQYFTP